jgi:hypothetical protein
VVEALFPAHGMAPAIRARMAFLRERMSSVDGLEVTCGGSSMEPIIRRGARVRVLPRAAQIGQVAAFVTSHGELELHRLVARVPGGWWAHLGDNQVDPTPGLVHASHIVGIADVPRRAPRPRERLRALTRIGRAAMTVARRALQPR